MYSTAAGGIPPACPTLNLFVMIDLTGFFQHTKFLDLWCYCLVSMKAKVLELDFLDVISAVALSSVKKTNLVSKSFPVTPVLWSYH